MYADEASSVNIMNNGERKTALTPLASAKTVKLESIAENEEPVEDIRCRRPCDQGPGPGPGMAVHLGLIYERIESVVKKSIKYHKFTDQIERLLQILDCRWYFLCRFCDVIVTILVC